MTYFLKFSPSREFVQNALNDTLVVKPYCIRLKGFMSKIFIMQLNPIFLSNIHNICGDVGKLWLTELPKTIQRLSKQWHFDFLHPLFNLSYCFVGLVKMQENGQTAVLKMACESIGAVEREVAWLQSMVQGVPLVYAYDEAHNAYLMEHLVPGESLKALVQAGHDDMATHIICDVIKSLQSTSLSADSLSTVSFKHLSELIVDFNHLDGVCDPKVLSKAKSLFHDLTTDRSYDVILHGDLHHGNIISCGEGWKAIDPHGYVGDPVAEVGAMIRNPYDGFLGERPQKDMIARRIDIMKDELSFDLEKMKAWMFCITVLSVAWTFEGHRKLDQDDLDLAMLIDP